MRIIIKKNDGVVNTFENNKIIPQYYRLPGLENSGSFFGCWDSRGIAINAKLAENMSCITPDQTSLPMKHVCSFADGGELILPPGYMLRYITGDNKIDIICST